MQLSTDFLWGGATADFQCEGGFGEGGRGVTTHDYETDGNQENPRAITYRMPDGTIGRARSSFFFADPLPEGAVPCFLDDEYYPSHKAIDHYHHWREDLELLAGMGMNVYRFSICWSRIYPTGMEEEPNEEGLRFYEQIIDTCLELGMQPLVTIHHDELPAVLAEELDGWSSRKTIDYYERYCRTLFERFGAKVKYWLTFNEINAVRGYASCGTHNSDNNTHYNAVHNMFLASARAVKLGHEMMDAPMFGTMYAFSAFYPATCKPEDVFAQMQKRRQSFYYIDTMVRGHYPAFAPEMWREKVFALFVDRMKMPLGHILVGVGSETSVSISNKLIAKAALDSVADGVILCHNHPSGEPKPGHDDLQATDSLRKGLKCLDINLLDHVILGEKTYFSFVYEVERKYPRNHGKAHRS